MFVTQISRRVAASPGDSLFTKALSYTVSVVKVNHVHDITAKRHLRREMFLCLPMGVFGKSIGYHSV